MNLRNRRMDAEWKLLQALAEANGAIVREVARLENEFHVTLGNSPAWIGATDKPRIETDHNIRYVYPRYYPTLPLEGYFVRPILHPNVDSATGFACLWNTYRPSQTIVDAILITRAIMCWKTVNHDPQHKMQKIHDLNALTIHELVIPLSCLPLLAHRSYKQRLSKDAQKHEPEESYLAFSDIK